MQLKKEEPRHSFICKFVNREDGRAYWSWNYSWHGLSPLTLEFYWKAKHNGIDFDWGDEEAQIGFSLFGLGLGGSIRVNHLPIPESWTGIKTKSNIGIKGRDYFYMPKNRRIGLRVWGWDEGGNLHSVQPEINFNLWTTDQWEPTFKGFDIGIPLLKIFGETQYRSQLFAERSKVILEMPEGSYEVDVKISLDTWKRPRLPGQLSLFRFDIENEVSIRTGQIKYGVNRGYTSMSGPLLEDGSLPDSPIEVAIERYRQEILAERIKYNYAPENNATI